MSLGHEDGASFATQSAFAAREAVEPMRAVLAAEVLVVARALRMGGWPHHGLRPMASDALATVADLLLATLPPDLADHDLGVDLEVAAGLLPTLAAVPVAPVEA